jgi:hypothetical protein
VFGVSKCVRFCRCNDIILTIVLVNHADMTEMPRAVSACDVRLQLNTVRALWLQHAVCACGKSCCHVGATAAGHTAHLRPLRLQQSNVRTTLRHFVHSVYWPTDIQGNKTLSFIAVSAGSGLEDRVRSP